MILSSKILNPYFYGDRLTQQSTRVFGDAKLINQKALAEVKLDYAANHKLEGLAKPEYLISNGVLRDTVDAPLIIEGQLTVSF